MGKCEGIISVHRDAETLGRASRPGPAFTSRVETLEPPRHPRFKTGTKYLKRQTFDDGKEDKGPRPGIEYPKRIHSAGDAVFQCTRLIVCSDKFLYYVDSSSSS